MNQLILMKRRMLEVLSRAQEQRGRRPQPNDWHRFEMEAMLEAVNHERKLIKHPPVTMEKLETIERTASGHFDYSSKFALYCAELALGQDEVLP